MSHTESETDPWKISIPDHPGRTDSPTFVHARDTMHKIMDTLADDYFGPGPWQAHHGGSLWVNDGQGWQLFLNLVGIEWSAQFICDPAKVERLRLNAKLLSDVFPDTVPALKELGYQDTVLLITPIQTAADVANWVDSIWNSCVPLGGPVHTGTLAQTHYQLGGRHHYPAPITDIQFVKRDDFDLWVTDASGAPMAVVPASADPADRRVEVVYSSPSALLHDAHVQANLTGSRLLLGPDHPLALAGFARVEGPSQ